MSFQQHSAWVNFLFESPHREVLPGYSKANLSQVVSCDKAAWARLATLNTREAAEDGSFPLGDALLGLKGDPSIALHLTPWPSQFRVPVRPKADLHHTMLQVQSRIQAKEREKQRGRGKLPQCHKNYVESITRRLQTSQFVLLTIHLQAAHI